MILVYVLLVVAILLILVVADYVLKLRKGSESMAAKLEIMASQLAVLSEKNNSTISDDEIVEDVS